MASLKPSLLTLVTRLQRWYGARLKLQTVREVLDGDLRHLLHDSDCEQPTLRATLKHIQNARLEMDKAIFEIGQIEKRFRSEIEEMENQSK